MDLWICGFVDLLRDLFYYQLINSSNYQIVFISNLLPGHRS